MSDSLIAWKPRIDEPSKPRPSSNTDWSNDETGTVKCCMMPGRSQKRTSTISTPSSAMNLSSSSLLLNIRSSSADPRASHQSGSGTPESRGGSRHRTYATLRDDRLSSNLRRGRFSTMTTLFQGCNRFLGRLVRTCRRRSLGWRRCRPTGSARLHRPVPDRVLGSADPGAVRRLDRLDPGRARVRRPGRVRRARVARAVLHAGRLRDRVRAVHLAPRRLVRQAPHRPARRTRPRPRPPLQPAAAARPAGGDRAGHPAARLPSGRPRPARPPGRHGHGDDGDLPPAHHHRRLSSPGRRCGGQQQDFLRPCAGLRGPDRSATAEVAAHALHAGRHRATRGAAPSGAGRRAP